MAVLCVAGQTYTLEFSLEDQSNAGLWKANPTIAAGDFQISVNGGAFENVDNIPTVTPAAGRRVALVISAAETTAAAAGGLIYIAGVDAAGDEWYDVAFSVRVVGAGSGDVATTGADGDTLETLSDQLDGVEPADVWAYATRTLTQSATSVASAVAGGTVTIHRGDSLSASITGLGDISTRTKLWFTVKDNLADTDAQSIIQIEETAGLVYLNAATGTAGLGDITVDDATAGDITITLDETATDDLVPASGLYYDIQWYDGTSIGTLSAGPCNITGDVTRAVA